MLRQTCYPVQWFSCRHLRKCCSRLVILFNGLAADAFADVAADSLSCSMVRLQTSSQMLQQTQLLSFLLLLHFLFFPLHAACAWLSGAKRCFLFRPSSSRDRGLRHCSQVGSLSTHSCFSCPLILCCLEKGNSSTSCHERCSTQTLPCSTSQTVVSIGRIRCHQSTLFTWTTSTSSARCVARPCLRVSCVCVCEFVHIFRQLLTFLLFEQSR